MPVLSRTALSESVFAVALLNKTILHFRPWASLRHSLCIWCASSRVGAIISARTPDNPGVDDGVFGLPLGDPRFAKMGRR